MLVLTRRIGESVTIEGVARVTVLKMRRRGVSLGFEAKDDIGITREELAGPVRIPARTKEARDASPNRHILGD